MSTTPASVLRDRDSGGDGKIAFVELFFDLIFVFTIIQLSHTLAHHFTPLGVVEALVLMLAVWWVWIFTTWVTNWLDPDRAAVRAMLFVLMFLGLLLSTSIPEAFGDRSLIFALAYVAMQVGRSVFALWSFRGQSPRDIRNFQRITCWLVASAPFWIGGALAGHEAQLALWLIAIAIEYASAAAGFAVPGLGRSVSSDWKVSGEHMAERCALFVIICLGETILVGGQQFIGLPLSAMSAVAFGVAFATTCVLWWVYFRFGHHHAALQIGHADDPGRHARWAFTYAHIPIVVGIIVTAVGTSLLLGHLEEPATLASVLALTGGPLLYLCGNLCFKTIVYGRVPLSHLVGIALLLIIGGFATGIGTLTVGTLALAALVIVAVWERLALSRSEPAA